MQLITNLYNSSIIMAISKQIIDIPQPMYETIDKALLSASEKSCKTNDIYAT